MRKPRDVMRKSKADRRRDKVIRLYNEGKSQPDIAKACGCSQATVSRDLAKYRAEIEEAESIHGPREAEPGAPAAPQPIPRELGQDPTSLAGIVRRDKADEITRLIADMPAQAVSRAAGFSFVMQKLMALIGDTSGEVPARVKLDAIKFYLTNGPERIRWGDHKIFAMAHPFAVPAASSPVDAVTPDGEGAGILAAMALIGSSDGREIYDVQPVQSDAGA